MNYGLKYQLLRYELRPGDSRSHVLAIKRLLYSLVNVQRAVPAVKQASMNNMLDTTMQAALSYIQRHQRLRDVGGMLNLETIIAIGKQVDERQIYHAAARDATLHTILNAGKTNMMVVWSTSIHEDIIDRALPKLRDKDKNTVKWASFCTDLSTLSESRAHEHAMRNSSQTVEQARAAWRKFIDDANREAHRIQDGYARSGARDVSELALQKWGAGNHAVMDETSPAHKGFQLYAQPRLTGQAAVDLIILYRFKREMDKHAATEARISTEQLREAVGKVRRNFADAFGNEMLLRVTETGGSW